MSVARVLTSISLTSTGTEKLRKINSLSTSEAFSATMKVLGQSFSREHYHTCTIKPEGVYFITRQLILQCTLTCETKEPVLITQLQMTK